MDRRVVLPAVLAVHLVVATVHGTAHAMVPVELTASWNAVVAVTTFVGPVLGVALARRNHPLGVPLFTVTMAGALLVGGVLHFLVENPDHVSAIPTGQWRFPFRASAVMVAVTPTIGVAVGAWGRGTGARSSPAADRSPFGRRRPSGP